MSHSKIKNTHTKITVPEEYSYLEVSLFCILIYLGPGVHIPLRRLFLKAAFLYSGLLQSNYIE